MLKLKLCVQLNGLDLTGHHQQCRAHVYVHYVAEIASSSQWK